MTILTTEQQVLDLPASTIAVLWQRDDWILDTTLYVSFGTDGSARYTMYDPNDRFATDHTYTNENLWAIATLRSTTSTISVADGTHRVADLAEAEKLPRFTVARTGDDIYQNFGGEWWPMDPWGRLDDGDILRTAELWNWHGAEGDGIIVLWDPTETGWTE